MSNTDQFKQLCDLANLYAAWARVEDSDGCAGIDGVTLERFAEDLDKRVIGQGDFYYSETSGGKRGCFLTDRARRTFITQFEQRINTLVQHPRAGLNVTWRGCIDIQVGHYIQLLRGEAAEYLPIEIR